MNQTSNQQCYRSQFSYLRKAFWPIENVELGRFIQMALLLFLILFNYTLLRNMKDTLVIATPISGSEVIPFLKLWLIMPSAIIFFFIYTKLSNLLSRERLFYVCLFSFLGFFAIFAFVIYPFKDFLHPSLESILAWQEKYPNVKWILSLYGIWSYSIFYVLAELWGVVVVSLLFWQFANEITSTDEAKRFYPLFGLVGNFALMASGLFIEWLSITCESSSLTSDPWRVRLTWVIVVILIVGVGIFLLYWLASRRCSTNECNSKTSKKIEEQSSKAKLKLSFIESLQYVFSSKYIGLVAVLVVCFGVSMNLIDVTWKSQIKACFPDPIDYFKFMGRFSILTGVGTITIIFLTKGFIGRFGWKIAAIITPVILLITSTIFFSFIISQERIDNMIGKFGFSTVFLALIIGAGQNIFTKGIKYSLFDSTKEMTYIPLDPELKAKGKAAVDVIGGRLGKSGGGFIQIILLTLTGGDQLFIAPYLFGIVFVVVLIWIVAIPALSQLYYSKLSENRSGR